MGGQNFPGPALTHHLLGSGLITGLTKRCRLRTDALYLSLTTWEWCSNSNIYKRSNKQPFPDIVCSLSQSSTCIIPKITHFKYFAHLLNENIFVCIFLWFTVINNAVLIFLTPLCYWLTCPRKQFILYWEKQEWNLSNFNSFFMDCEGDIKWVFSKTFEGRIDFHLVWTIEENSSG